MSTFNCTRTPCQLWSPCVQNTCQCPTGYHGGFCELRWMDDNARVFVAFQWSAVALNIVLLLLSVWFFLQYWWLRMVPFPRVNKPMVVRRISPPPLAFSSLLLPFHSAHMSRLSCSSWRQCWCKRLCLPWIPIDSTAMGAVG